MFHKMFKFGQSDLGTCLVIFFYLKMFIFAWEDFIVKDQQKAKNNTMSKKVIACST